LALSGRLTFKEGCRFWREQRPEEWTFRQCLIDLSGVTECSENGLAWLQIFLRWARSVDVDVCFVEAPPEVATMLEGIGVPVYYHRLDGDDS
jgi:ABC-type transporter Mla MlaB component